MEAVNGMTNDAVSISATDKQTKNMFVTVRRPGFLNIAKINTKLPRNAANIISSIKQDSKTKTPCLLFFKSLCNSAKFSSSILGYKSGK